MGTGKVRWGLLSTARINERQIPAIRAAQRSELFAVASQSPQKAQAYADEWQIPRAHGSYEQLLADADVDAVYISLPNTMHCDWAIKAADAGKHILCEKPMALTPQDVDRMGQAAARNGVVLHEAIMMRFHAQTRRLQELMEQKTIGDLRLIRGVMTFTLERPEDIRLDAQLGGGSVWDLGGYPVSFIRTMAGGEPVEVHGWQTTSDSGVDLSFAGHLRFAGGAIGQFLSSFAALAHYDADLLGTTGLVRLDMPWANNVGATANMHITKPAPVQQSATFSDNVDNVEQQTITHENLDPYQDQIDSMEAMILDGADPVVSIADSRGNAATVAALCQSAREGRPVSL
jgi:predicted dehydrogenase